MRVRRRRRRRPAPPAAPSRRRGATRAGPAGPERPDERQARHRVHSRRDRSCARRQPSYQEQRRVADDAAPRRTAAASRRGSGAIGTNSGSMPNRSTQRIAQQRVRGPRARVGGDRPDLRRAASGENSATDATGPSDDDRRGPARCGRLRAAQILDRRDHARRRWRSRAAASRTSTGTSKRSENSDVLQLEAVDQRPGVEICQRRRDESVDIRIAALSAIASNRAVPLDRLQARGRGCCRESPRSGSAAVPRSPGRRRHTPSTSSAPMVSATCASFGP